MCRGKKYCSELDADSRKWSKFSPLLPPEWFSDELDLFVDAVRAASEGKVKESIEILSKIKSDELREWYCEHGQMSGMFRSNALGITTADSDARLDALRSPDKYRKEVFQRDGYTCQYCGMRVVPKEVFSAYSKLVGEDFFQDTGTNNERHGIVLAFRANADHVVPWNYGGLTNPDNLITSCWSCNYGKSGYTLEEIGLNDPRERKLSNGEWLGLTECVSKMKN